MALDQIDVDDYDVDDLRSGASKEMSFLDHLEELRWHLIRAVASILIIAIVVFVMKDFIFKKIVFAPKEASFLTYRDPKSTRLNSSHVAISYAVFCLKQ